MTPEKKRLFWLLILIIFFFANLITGTVLFIRINYPNTPAASTAPARPAR